MSLADGELHRIGDVAAIRQDDDIAGLQYHRALRAAFVREGMDVPAAPVVEMPALVGVAPLRHHRVLAAVVRQLRAGLAHHAHALGALVQ